MRVAILGCGYVGLELGRQLAADHDVVGVRRSEPGLDEIEASVLPADRHRPDVHRRGPRPRHGRQRHPGRNLFDRLVELLLDRVRDAGLHRLPDDVFRVRRRGRYLLTRDFPPLRRERIVQRGPELQTDSVPPSRRTAVVGDSLLDGRHERLDDRSVGQRERPRVEGVPL